MCFRYKLLCNNTECRKQITVLHGYCHRQKGSISAITVSVDREQQENSESEDEIDINMITKLKKICQPSISI